MSQPEFERYSPSYDELLKDPIRDRFTAGESIFFHVRKRDLIRQYFSRRKMATLNLSYLDIGCGKGELLKLLRDDFGHVAGCDPSPGMLRFADGIDARVQHDPTRLPFEDASFDFVTAVCVYHHVPVDARLALSVEIARVARPGGTFAIIEHNPYNPVTRTIVGRTPVDADAILLPAGETKQWMQRAGFQVESCTYFLYFPEPVYRLGGKAAEGLLGRLPFGGQYAVFASKEAAQTKQ
jgi:SAM-dependent methyltransferase